MARWGLFKQNLFSFFGLLVYLVSFVLNQLEKPDGSDKPDRLQKPDRLENPTNQIN